MSDFKKEFTNVTSLRAEALGRPGQRTFRILVDSGSSSAVLWLEKEQLFQLALAINQLLVTISKEQPTDSSPLDGKEMSLPCHMEFKVDKLTLSHDDNSGKFIIDAYDVELGEGCPATVRLWGSGSKVREFAEEAFNVCAAGRQVCQLCGRPIDDAGHLCVRTNGHGVLDLQDM